MIPIWLEKLATGRVVALALALWLGSTVASFVLGPYAEVQAAGGGALLEESVGYGPAEARAWLDRLGEAGRSAYWRFQWLDGVSALLMTAALALSLAFTLSRLLAGRNPLRALVYLPAVAGGSELVENGLLLRMLSSYPAAAPVAEALAGPVTGVKLVAGFAALLLVLGSFVALGIRRVRGRRPRRAGVPGPSSDGR